MHAWIISFWTALSAFLFITIIFCWLIVQNKRLQQQIDTCRISTDYIVQMYLHKSIIYIRERIGNDTVNETDSSDFIKRYSTELTNAILSFPRRQQILENMTKNLETHAKFSLFVFPDVLILQIRLPYYDDLLRYTAPSILPANHAASKKVLEELDFKSTDSTTEVSVELVEEQSRGRMDQTVTDAKNDIV